MLPAARVEWPSLWSRKPSACWFEAVKKAFVVVASKTGDPAATKDYLVSHSRTPALFGPDGKPIALVPVDDTMQDGHDDAPPEAVRDFLARFVQ